MRLPRFARNDIKGGRGQVPPLQVNVVAKQSPSVVARHDSAEAISSII
jgi:hypothetical protein